MNDKIIKELEEKSYSDDFDNTIVDLKDVIKILEKYNNIEWIPCSERLPKAVSSEYFSRSVNVKDANGWFDVGYYDHEKQTWRPHSGEYSVMHKIIAWQPIVEEK